MSSWRPDNWDNPHNRLEETWENYYRNPEYDAFEAGADAMLEALFKLAEESPTRTFTIDSNIVNIYRGTT